MGSFAVIAPFHGRLESAKPLLERVFMENSVVPDETWFVCGDAADRNAVQDAAFDMYTPGLEIAVKETPRRPNGGYAELPYAYCINWALHRTQCDYVVYLDNNSMPSTDKYEIMRNALDTKPVWGAVYCTQERTGHAPTIEYAQVPVGDAFCVLNFTQVMHRLTPDRWPTDIALGNPDLADGYFWRSLHERFGDFYPVGGKNIHDWHHIPSVAAAGL